MRTCKVHFPSAVSTHFHTIEYYTGLGRLHSVIPCVNVFDTYVTITAFPQSAPLIRSDHNGNPTNSVSSKFFKKTIELQYFHLCCPLQHQLLSLFVSPNFLKTRNIFSPINLTQSRISSTCLESLPLPRAVNPSERPLSKLLLNFEPSVSWLLQCNFS